MSDEQILREIAAALLTAFKPDTFPHSIAMGFAAALSARADELVDTCRSGAASRQSELLPPSDDAAGQE